MYWPPAGHRTLASDAASITRGCRIVLPAGHVEEFIDATHVLVATGRRPNVHNLGLEAAKVVRDAAGAEHGAGDARGPEAGRNQDLENLGHPRTTRNLVSRIASTASI